MTDFKSLPIQTKLVKQTVHLGKGTAFDPNSGRTVAPTFTVSAGEVIYIGTQIFRFTIPGDKYEIVDDQEELAEEVIEDSKYAAIRDLIETRLIEVDIVPRNILGAAR